ncbi:MAG TPA: ATP-binding protein [Thermoanaerobaculia bacterium]|nr:ATP-binding protein [Thermoanaerobaculia bacterium]
MDSTIRRTLWGAFFVLTLLVAVGLGLTVTVLQIGRRQESRIVHGSEPLLDAVQAMNGDVRALLGSSRGYLLTQQTQFLQQYDDAVRDFERQALKANQLASAPQEMQVVSRIRKQFADIKGLTDEQITLAREGRSANANEYMLEAARLQRSTPDFADALADQRRRQQDIDLEQIASLRQGLTLVMIVVSIVIVALGGYTLWRIEQSLRHSINREVRRTEAMIAGMSDGVVVVDREGKSVYINPAGERLLGQSQVGVPITQQSDVYRLRKEDGSTVDALELPTAQALATGKPIMDVTMMIARDDKKIAISVNATPLQEGRRTTGAIVTFRDITERQHLEEELQLQAERAQILADAGAFFSSNIDPVWVTQAIAERVAEVLGDWSAVILKTADSNELRVASIYHRDMSSLGLAWSYIYRQPLLVGEGIIGQVVSTGYPAMISNLGSASTGVSTQRNVTSYHAPTMQLASLLILPLRTRREMIGALVIAANDPERRMTDDKLPLAEQLAERAALAAENAKLYTEQVDARRKVEDLSRLKDEFLSIASHELRTPVTSIKGYTQLAKTLIREQDLETSEEYLDIALDQIDRMSRLILELLDVSRIETGRLEIRHEPISWIQFVRNLVHHHHTSVSDRRFHLNVPDSDLVVVGDRDRLEQVLGNLLENAVKYSPEGSEIFVDVAVKGDQVVTSVCDRGIGIPNDELNQVFERFHRGRQVSSTNYGGLGLGLYITKQIVDRHGGSISVESKEGSGTTFFFALPATAAPAVDTAPPRQEAAQALTQ